MAVAIVVAGAGSFAFHRSPTAWASWLDATGVGLVALAWVVARIAWARGWPKGRSRAGWGAGAAVVAATVAVLPGAGADLLLLGLVAAASAVEVALLRAARPAGSSWLAGAGATLAAGAAIWALARRDGPWCDPESLLQGHAAWHVMAAAGLGLLLVYLWRATDPSPGRRAAG